MHKCGLYTLFSGRVLQLHLTIILRTVDSGCENSLSQGGTEQPQTKQLGMAQRIAYYQRS